MSISIAHLPAFNQTLERASRTFHENVTETPADNGMIDISLQIRGANFVENLQIVQSNHAFSISEVIAFVPPTEVCLKRLHRKLRDNTHAPI